MGQIRRFLLAVGHMERCEATGSTTTSPADVAQSPNPGEISWPVEAE